MDFNKARALKLRTTADVAEHKCSHGPRGFHDSEGQNRVVSP